MIDYIPPATVSATNTGSGTLNGIDLLTSIQMLMVQDYDSQLKSLGNQIKGTTKVKKLYRQDIEKTQKLLARESGKESRKDSVSITPGELSDLNKTNEYIFDTQNNEVQPYTTPIDSKDNDYITGEWNQAHTEKWVKRDVIDKKIENYKLKLESLNEQSELVSLGLQSLTNQRKIAFETISTLVNKQHDSVATIIRNVKG